MAWIIHGLKSENIVFLLLKKGSEMKFDVFVNKPYEQSYIYLNLKRLNKRQ